MFRLSPRIPLGLALILAATSAGAAEAGAVTVRFDHPENFSETREVRAFAPSRADSSYLDRLARYIERRAGATLAPDQRLDIVVTDVDRAGSYLPSLGLAQPVRIVEDAYPPRIRLRFRLLDAEGRVIREGQRRLTDLAFLYAGGINPGDSDPLRYEKRLIDRWLARGPERL